MKKQKHITSSKRITEVPAVIIGVMVSLLFGIALTLGLTSLLTNGMFDEAGVENWIFVIRTVACVIGCLVGMTLIKKNRLLIAGAIALGYIVILIAIGIVAYDGSFNNILSGAMSVLMGGALSCLTVLKPLKKSKYAVRYRQ